MILLSFLKLPIPYSLNNLIFTTADPYAYIYNKNCCYAFHINISTSCLSYARLHKYELGVGGVFPFLKTDTVLLVKTHILGRNSGRAL